MHTLQLAGTVQCGGTVMSFGADFGLTPELGVLPAPALVAYAKLLALPGAELEMAVAHEIAENPALILDDTHTCGACGLPANPPCPYCGLEGGRCRSSSSGDQYLTSPEAVPTARVTWPEGVLRDLRLVLSGRHADVAAIVVGSLDDRGYLTEDAPELARLARSDPATIEHVIRTLRETGPPGVGARDLRDCLLLQIDRLAAEDVTHPIARAVVSDHLEALARGATASIGRQLGVPAEDVADARAFIRHELLPRPAVEDADQQNAPRAPVRPDVALVQSADGPGNFRVDVLEQQRLPLRIDPAFRRVARANGAMADLVGRGDFFLARLRERWATMRRITEHVAGQRPDLLAGQPEPDQRLTRAGVAASLGLHPSTVSRATAGRFILLPSRRVLAYAECFDTSIGVRSRLQAIIATEDRPLSDAELAERLRRSGLPVARRTVAKYRGRLRVLPSTHR